MKTLKELDKKNEQLDFFYSLWFPIPEHMLYEFVKENEDNVIEATDEKNMMVKVKGEWMSLLKFHSSQPL